jgi:hypothetical protein
MKRSTLLSLVLGPLLLTACGSGEVFVSAEVQVQDPDTGEQVVRPIDNLSVQLLPFDRDAIFDSLEAAASSPEPQLPDELKVALDSIQAAQTEWRESEARWLALRDRMQQINTELEQYNPAEARYRELFNEFDEAERDANAAERTKDDAFARFDGLQQETFSELEGFKAQRAAWEDDAFAAYGEVQAAKLSASGHDILADTTDATGRAEFTGDNGPAPGQWWVYTRYTLATEELYWNLPITVERGTPVELTLNRENAEIREVY